MDYKLIVFDWDGTLMDSEARIVACLQAACRDVGLAAPSRDQAKDVIGLGLQEACARMLPAVGREVHLRVSEAYRHHFLSADPTPSSLFEGVEAMLSELDARGHYLAIATGKGRAGLNAVLAETGLKHHFHATRCADETRSKPHPQMLHELLDYFGLYARDAVMVGDTEYDLQMARNAKMDALAVSYGVHEVERLLAQAPLGVVDSIAAMRHWLLNQTTQKVANDVTG